jgi:hypothetical protein
MNFPFNALGLTLLNILYLSESIYSKNSGLNLSSLAYYKV